MPTEPKFAVVVLTAPPPGLAHEAGGPHVRLDGREALLRSVELFVNRAGVVHIQLVATTDELAMVKDRYGPHLSFSGVKVINGGPRWADQIAAAVLPAEATHVLVHDAARPLVPYTDLEAVMAAAADRPAVALATPVRSAVVQVDEGGQPMAVDPPGGRMHLLTPQAFDRATFAEMATTKAEVHPSRLSLVKGSPLNVRLGGPADAAFGKALMGLLPKPKVRSAGAFEEAQW